MDEKGSHLREGEIMTRKGLRVWSVQQGPELIRTYVSEPCD